MKTLTPLKAIRKNCVECSGGSLKNVRECHITDCHFYEYRLGKNFRRKGIGGKCKSKKIKVKNEKVEVQSDTQLNLL